MSLRTVPHGYPLFDRIFASPADKENSRLCDLCKDNAFAFEIIFGENVIYPQENLSGSKEFLWQKCGHIFHQSCIVYGLKTAKYVRRKVQEELGTKISVRSKEWNKEEDESCPICRKYSVIYRVPHEGESHAERTDKLLMLIAPEVQSALALLRSGDENEGSTFNKPTQAKAHQILDTCLQELEFERRCKQKRINLYAEGFSDDGSEKPPLGSWETWVLFREVRVQSNLSETIDQA